MSYYFTPPTAPLVPAAVNPSHPGFSLFRHYRNWDAGINVWIVAGQVTTQEPDREFVTPDAEFLGGHIHEVTADQASLLVAAGYTVMEATPDALPTPFAGFTDVHGDSGTYAGGSGLSGFQDVYGDVPDAPPADPNAPSLEGGFTGFEDVHGDSGSYAGSDGLPGFQDTPSDDSGQPAGDGLPGFEDVYGDTVDNPEPEQPNEFPAEGGFAGFEDAEGDTVDAPTGPGLPGFDDVSGYSSSVYYGGGTYGSGHYGGTE